MLMDGETMIAQLHLWDVHDHPHMGDEADPTRGNVRSGYMVARAIASS